MAGGPGHQGERPPKVIQLPERYVAQIYARRIQLEEEDVHELSGDTGEKAEEAQTQTDQ